MPRSTLPRTGLATAGLLLAILALAAGLGIEATRATDSHRATAEAAANHYAAIAAWHFARSGREWIGYGMNQASGQIWQALPSAHHGRLPGPELLRKVLAEKDCDCMSAGFSRTIFRITLGDIPELDLIGEPLSDSTKAGLIRATRSDSVARKGPRRWRILAPGEPALARRTDIVLLWLVGPKESEPSAAYGMVVEPAQIARPLVGALSDVEFFPPSMTGRTRNDSLVHIAVAGAGGSILSAQWSPRAFVAADTMGWVFGGLQVTAAIEPDAATRLAGSGIPPSRGPQIVALLFLTVAMGGAALVLLRREQRLARLREDFVSGVSHELRTPLTQIRMLSELLHTDGFKTDAERSRATNVISREARKLTNLVDNVLQFDRLRRVREPLPQQRVQLGTIVTELAESFQPMLDGSGSRLDVSVTPDLEIPGDPDAVTRIVRNLLENAVKFGPPGQTIRLTVGPANGAGGARISVADEGLGVPPADRARIWQPYQRLDRDQNGPVGGSGLGLSVVAELVGRSGGRAWVEDAQPTGARFVVEFPGEPAAAG
jgi:signal transduction histidine kinase